VPKERAYEAQADPLKLACFHIAKPALALIEG
jgi:hypothetical protein